MNRKEIKKLLLVILEHVDYDIYKSYIPETAEEPEYAKEQMESLINVAEEHLKSQLRKR